MDGGDGVPEPPDSGTGDFGAEAAGDTVSGLLPGLSPGQAGQPPSGSSPRCGCGKAARLSRCLGAAPHRNRKDGTMGLRATVCG